MSYRIIALDLDGTLLTAKKQILPESLHALSLARQKGVKVIIVTGRHHITVKPFYHALQVDTPVLCCNGTYSYDFQQQRVLENNPLSLEQSLNVIDLLKHHHVHCIMYTDDTMAYEVPSETTSRWDAWSSGLPIEHRPNIIQINNFSESAKQAKAIWKFATTAENEQILKKLSHVVENDMGLSCEQSWHNQMDIAQSGNNKGTLLKRWVEQQGFDMKDVISFGDNFNDISMLQMAGMGVAMANSSDDIKESADFITTDNESPGIADVIHKYVL